MTALAVVMTAGAPAVLGADTGAGRTPGRIVAVREGTLVILASGDGHLVRSLDRVGTAPSGVDPTGTEAEALAPTPDGRAVFVTRFEGDMRDVVRVRTDGSRTTVAVEDAHAPSLSPDGRFLAFLRGDDTFVVRNLRTDHERTTDDRRAVAGHERRFVWTADGDQIAYTRSYDDKNEQTHHAYGLIDVSEQRLRIHEREVGFYVELVGRDGSELVALYGYTGWIPQERYPLEPGPWNLARFAPETGPGDRDTAPPLHVELTGRPVDVRSTELLSVVPYERTLARGRRDDAATAALASRITTAAWLPTSTAAPGEPELPLRAPPTTSAARLAKVVADLPAVLGPIASAESRRCATADETKPAGGTDPVFLGCWEGAGPLPTGVDWDSGAGDRPAAAPLLTVLREAGIAGWVSGQSGSGPIIDAADDATALVLEVDPLEPQHHSVGWCLVAWAVRLSPETGGP